MQKIKIKIGNFKGNQRKLTGNNQIIKLTFIILKLYWLSLTQK